MPEVPEGLININGDSVQVLEIIFMMAFFTILPSLVVLMTSFTRYIICFSFLRTAMGTQQTPPNIILVGLALFLTFFTMSPTLSRIQTEAYEPYVAEEISQEEFFRRAVVPLEEFMVRNTRDSTLSMFCDMAGVDLPEPVNTDTAVGEVPLRVIVPAFAVSELQRAFTIGLLLYIPFMLIDIVVSCTLMSMGMIMLPPSMISAPFKLLLFVSLNGWELLFSTLVQGFQ